MDTIIDAAIKLSQGGPIIILVFIIMALMYACKKLFEAFQAQSDRLIPTIEGMTSALETHTRTLQDMASKSEANTQATRAVLELLDSIRDKLTEITVRRR